MHSELIRFPVHRVLLGGLVALSAAQAQAQVGQSAGLEEVIVTARKVRENLQDTPIAVSAFTGDALVDRQVFRTTELDQLVPNLQFADNAPLAGNNSSSQVFIRGIGQTDPTSTVDPGVGLYIDDVYIGTALGGTLALRDIASVQVLRGPQGTLFGRNTIGGAILITTTEPGEEFGGTARGAFGSDSLLDGFVAIDVPFSDTFLSRFALGIRQQDGYVTRTDGTDLGDTDTYTATAKFAWTPNDDFTAKLGFDYTDSDENGSPLVFATINEAATFPRVASSDAGCPGFNGSFLGLPAVPAIPDERCANDLQARGPYSNNGTLPLESTLENYGISLNLEYAISDSTAIKSITSYRSLDWTGVRDADNTPLTILHTFYDVDSSQWSEELQLTYETSDLTGVVGLYYFEQESDDIVTIELNPPPPGIQRDSDNNKVDNDSWAAFTQWTYRFNERLALTAGGRYTEETKRSFPDQFDYATPDIKQVPVQWYDATFSDFTPSASLSYRWSDEAMTYVSYSEGFKGGGWNSHFNIGVSPEALDALHDFAPETAETIEVGFKLDLAGRTLRLNGAIFTSDYTDMQVTYRGPAPNGVAPFITNAGEAGIDGAELEMTWVPTSDWMIDASVGYLDASIDELDNIPLAILPPGLVEGNVLPFAPEWQWHLGVAYDIHAGDFLITPRVDASYQDTTYFDATNTPEIAQLDDVTVVNATVLVGPDGGDWRVRLGVNNATDEEYPIAGNSSLTTGSGYAEIAYSRPREYFAQLIFDF
jgi:iron complex outermembrane receptor protein